MSAHRARERAIKAALEPLLEDEATWEEMLGMLHSRAMRKALVTRRIELGMSREELAKKLDVSVKSVVRFETEPWPDPYLSTLRRYCLVLGLQVAFEILDMPKDLEDQEGSGE